MPPGRSGIAFRRRPAGGVQSDAHERGTGGECHERCQDDSRPGPGASRHVLAPLDLDGRYRIRTGGRRVKSPLLYLTKLSAQWVRASTLVAADGWWVKSPLVVRGVSRRRPSSAREPFGSVDGGRRERLRLRSEARMYLVDDAMRAWRRRVGGGTLKCARPNDSA